ncbi:MAG: hypothetical protein HOP12_08685 [Candidatus Eisenbacteria bacterium]|uniref:Uncharacterized protein n=1 Tax=Eiseniibacteriota bacterium TaxID=2212470 RepID=A0A849SYR8_UNCEI|nr:hypothetical protein [Candidatus Eisenbacteria bacterium]
MTARPPLASSFRPGEGRVSKWREVARRLRTGYREGWRRHGAGDGLTMGVVLAVLGGAAYRGRGIYYFLDFRDGGRRYAGLLTLLSGFCLLIYAWSPFLVWRRLRRARVRGLEPAAWLLGALIGVFLAFDETVQLHDSGARVLGRLGVPELFGMLDRDLYIFGAYAVTAILGAWLARRRLLAHLHVLLPGTRAIVCLLISQLSDLAPWDTLGEATRQWLGTLEEGTKCFGTFCLALFGFGLSESVASDPDGEATPS